MRGDALQDVADKAAALRLRLASLPLVVDHASCEVFDVDVPSYPDGPRPSSVVTLLSDGVAGRGEHVGWTRAAHAAFATRLAELPLARCRRVDDVTRLAARALDDPYDRAALEAAAIDLALRQSQTNMATLAGATAATVRYVVSFERTADPVARAERELAAGAPGLKIDADPSWADGTFGALARLGSVAVLDFKQAGAPADHERAHRLVPDALIEDPCPGRARWSASLRGRLGLDAPLTSAGALASLRSLPAAVNVKPARMGGVLEALAGVAWSAARGIAPYLGGMFEVGVGRAQLRVLAAILCPEGPNDIAPIAVAGRAAERPARLPVHAAGHGFAVADDARDARE